MPVKGRLETYYGKHPHDASFAIANFSSRLFFSFLACVFSEGVDISFDLSSSYVIFFRRAILNSFFTFLLLFFVVVVVVGVVVVVVAVVLFAVVFVVVLVLVLLRLYFLTLSGLFSLSTFALCKIQF